MGDESSERKADAEAGRRTIEVSVGDACLPCSRTGDVPSVVFLHAGVADRRSWYAIMDALAPEYGCAAYDRRGFGDSRYRPQAYSQTGDLGAVLDALQCGPVVLVGNSQGGRIAVDFALQFPGRVRALYLIAPALSGAPEPASYPAATERLGAAIEAADEAGDMQRVNELEAQLWLDGPESKPGRVTGAVRELFLDMNGKALAAAETGDAEEAASAHERMGELELPVHVVVGEHDLEAITARGMELARCAPQGTCRLLAGRAHLPQLEDPLVFSSELKVFLASLGTSPDAG